MKSPVWDNIDAPITQGFGVNLPNVPDDWYAYSADWGLDYGDHAGLDIGVPKLTPIYALTPGTVTESGPNPYFRPNPVMVKTPDNNLEVIYGHLWQDAVNVGDTVNVGDLIGYSGEQTLPGTMTPDGSGPHLHLEVRDLPDQRVIDPTTLLTGASFTPDGSGARPSDQGSSGGGGGIAGAIGDALHQGAGLAKRAGIGLLGLAVALVGLYFLVPQARALMGGPAGIARAVAKRQAAA